MLCIPPQNNDKFPAMQHPLHTKTVSDDVSSSLAVFTPTVQQCDMLLLSYVCMRTQMI
jgi:hypothetical protein